MPTVVDDRYELLEVLASGGMATVWRARDKRLGRLVALKRPHPAPAESKLHERMEREARAAAGVSHPNLVTMFDTGHDEGGPYLVMELVDGPTLASPGREIGPSEAVAIGAQIADALAAVHDAGIVHRDVKPSNVILAERGPCLTDFGIASFDETTSDLTQPGTIMVTPSYAAPEVLGGEPPSPASDVFSLTAVIYGLVSGAPPYQGTNRPPSLPGVGDPQLDAVMRAGLAVDPDERPSARELAASLRANSPTGAMPMPHATLPLPMPVPDEVVAVAADTTTAPADSVEPTERGPGRLRLAPVVLVAAVLALVVWAARSSETAAENIPVTTALVTNSSAATTTSPATTVSVDPVVAARDRLAAILAGIRPPEFKPKERTDITESVDRAITAAAEDPDEAEDAIRRVADSIGEALEGDSEREAMTALADLAGALGLEFSPESNED